MNLDLGCGKDADHNGFLGVDKVDFGQKFVMDIEKDGLKGIDGESVDKIIAYNFLEHIEELIFVMNECWRVLKYGGSMRIKVPRYPSESAFSDPTHVRCFTFSTFNDYFCGELPRNADYGIKKWEMGKNTIYEKGMDIYLIKRKK